MFGVARCTTNDNSVIVLPMENADELIGSPEAASIIGVSRATLTRWVQAGDLEHAKKLPGQTGAALFYRADIEAKALERKRAVTA